MPFYFRASNAQQKWYMDIDGIVTSAATAMSS